MGNVAKRGPRRSAIGRGAKLGPIWLGFTAPIDITSTALAEAQLGIGRTRDTLRLMVLTDRVAQLRKGRNAA